MAKSMISSIAGKQPQEGEMSGIHNFLVKQKNDVCHTLASSAGGDILEYTDTRKGIYVRACGTNDGKIDLYLVHNAKTQKPKTRFYETNYKVHKNLTNGEALTRLKRFFK